LLLITNHFGCNIDFIRDSDCLGKRGDHTDEDLGEQMEMEQLLILTKKNKQESDNGMARTFFGGPSTPKPHLNIRLIDNTYQYQQDPMDNFMPMASMNSANKGSARDDFSFNAEFEFPEELP
jgi:hypothetical protein